MTSKIKTFQFEFECKDPKSEIKRFEFPLWLSKKNDFYLTRELQSIMDCWNQEDLLKIHQAVQNNNENNIGLPNRLIISQSSSSTSLSSTETPTGFVFFYHNQVIRASFLYFLLVDEPCRSQSIGTGLLNQVLNQSNTTSVLVPVRDTKLIQWFLKRGFFFTAGMSLSLESMKLSKELKQLYLSSSNPSAPWEQSQFESFQTLDEHWWMTHFPS